MKTLELLPVPPILFDQTVRFICQLVRKTDGETENVQELWYEFPKEIDISWRHEDMEPYLIAMILQAMYEDRKIVAKGTVSAELLSNLTEYRDFWNLFFPDLLKAVEITCDHIEEDEIPRPHQKAIAGFSAGLDGMFLVWRHIKKQAGYRTQPLSACAMIHGFDMLLSNEDIFTVCFLRAKKFLNTLGLPLILIRTNIHEVATFKFNYSFNTALVSSFQFLKSMFDTLLIASAEPYSHLVIPGGSSPLSDPLLSSSRLRVIHDGAAFSRSEKARCVHEWGERLDYLRVCWRPGPSRSLNCGRCEKCLRTMANFAVNRLPIPKSLNGDLTLLNKGIKDIRLSTRGQILEWSILRKEARKNKIRDPWVRWIPWLMIKYRIRKIRKGLKGYLKTILRMS